jgi:hypothetical protein
MGKVHRPDDCGVQRQMRECKLQQEGGTTLPCGALFILVGLLPEGPVRLTAQPSLLGLSPAQQLWLFEVRPTG